MKITAIVHPNSKNPRIETDLLSQLHVYVHEPPLEGKANRAVIKTLAKYFSISENKIFLIKGEKSKTKLFEIN